MNTSSNATRGATVATLCAALTLTLAACASTPPPTEQLAVSTAAVASAVTAGGTELAAAETRMARDKLAQANKAMVDKDYVAARVLAEESQVDAQLGQRSVSEVRVSEILARDPVQSFLAHRRGIEV